MGKRKGDDLRLGWDVVGGENFHELIEFRGTPRAHRLKLTESLIRFGWKLKGAPQANALATEGAAVATADAILGLIYHMQEGNVFRPLPPVLPPL